MIMYMKSTVSLSGLTFTLGAYLMWGVLPLYWKALQSMPAPLILAHRVVGALVFTALLLFVFRQAPLVFQALKVRKNRLYILGAAVTITLNWGVYIWAVNDGRIVETALGYYINPLLSVLLAVVFLKEKLSRLQIFSLILALGGVLIMSFSHGGFPWIGLSLALSFALYGLFKKMMPAPALVSLHLETLFALPLALFLLFTGGAAADPGTVGPWGWALILGAGPVTALPLLFFGIGARKIPLAFVGILQYSSPTVSLLLGVFLFGEHFGPEQAGAFGLIWISLVIFTVSQLRKKSTSPV